MPLIVLPGWMIGLLNIAIWVGWFLAIGYLAHRLPLTWLAGDSWLTRPRRWELGGRLYSRVLHIHRWKDRLPELGAAFNEGFAKRSVGRGDRQVIARFICETRRAEYAHLGMLAIWPVFILFNPPWAVAVNAAFALAANVPCLLVQRYNRIRLTRVANALDHRLGQA